MPTCLVIEHGPEERPYVIGAALTAAGVAVETCRPYAGDAVPLSARSWAGVVVMGGAMSAASDDGFPSRGAELALLADAVAHPVPVLGVCLGAQLLAQATGGRAFAGPAGPELGWTRVRLSQAAASDPLLHGLPEHLGVLNWHGDTFDLPPGAVALASGRRYPNQAFRLGPSAWGLQFHIEVDQAAVEEFIAGFGHEEAPEAMAALATAAPAALGELGPPRDQLLTRFAALVAHLP